jgi:glycosyltransferase involved in cell wall biosynthesis
MAPRVIAVVGADTSTDTGIGPRRDYAVLATRLGATVIDRRSVDRSLVARFIRRMTGSGPAQAWLAFRRRADADVIVTDGEHVGIPLALLLAASRSRVKHITIAHRLTSPKKRVFLRTLRAHDRIDRIAVHSRHQHEFARLELGIPAERLAFLPYQVDTEFWAPTRTAEERLVVSAGLEYRDYPTLLRATRGLDAQVVIGAASNWSRHGFAADVLSPNARVGSFDYAALRDLYARAAIVVVPLLDVDNQAGVTTILEAMAMGKAVIVTQSRGQTDVVEDRRAPERGVPRPRPVSLARVLAAERRLDLAPNGFYVPPADEDALRRAITYLLDHPEERARLGRAGRDLATKLFTVDDFAARIAELVAAIGPRDAATALPRLQYG